MYQRPGNVFGNLPDGEGFSLPRLINPLQQRPLPVGGTMALSASFSAEKKTGKRLRIRGKDRIRWCKLVVLSTSTKREAHALALSASKRGCLMHKLQQEVELLGLKP